MNRQHSIEFLLKELSENPFYNQIGRAFQSFLIIARKLLSAIVNYTNFEITLKLMIAVAGDSVKVEFSRLLLFST